MSKSKIKDLTAGIAAHIGTFAQFSTSGQTIAKPLVSGSLPVANPHNCPQCSWHCTCADQPCSCCSGNDR